MVINPHEQIPWLAVMRHVVSKGADGLSKLVRVGRRDGPLGPVSLLIRHKSQNFIPIHA